MLYITIYRIAGYFCGYKFLRFGHKIDWINFCGFYFCGRRSTRNNFCESNIRLIKGRFESIKIRVVWHLYSDALEIKWFPIIAVNKIIIYNQIWPALVKIHLKLKKIWYWSPCLPVPKPLYTTKQIFTRWPYGHVASILSIDNYSINNWINLQVGKQHLSMINVCRHPSQCIQPN